MITELKSIPDIWKRMPSEMHARRFLEGSRQRAKLPLDRTRKSIKGIARGNSLL
jgi:hypothetical protein